MRWELREQTRALVAMWAVRWARTAGAVRTWPCVANVPMPTEAAAAAALSLATPG